MANELQIRVINGTMARDHLADIARLRLTVFRDFPYLYDGTIEYEKKYLETYFRCEEARVVLCQDQKQFVGASTVVPLKFEDVALQAPFVQLGVNPAEVMYFGESLLLTNYRGRGVGKRFFEERLKHALETPGIKKAAFCAVMRPSTHPLRPQDYRPLDGLWHSFGFRPVEGLSCQMTWKQVDEAQESPKTLQFWVREL